jgi:hypothetical protein
MPLRRLVEAEKTISSPVQWTEPDREIPYVRFLVALDIAGVTETTLQLSGGTYIDTPDKHVTFELAVVGDKASRRTRLMRIDWRSLHGGHSNIRSTDGAWAGRRVPETHFHPFDFNYIEGEGRMRRGKLPYAQPLEPEPQTFEELRAQAGLLFGIKNMHVVPRPDWVYSLFGRE